VEKFEFNASLDCAEDVAINGVVVVVVVGFGEIFGGGGGAGSASGSGDKIFGAFGVSLIAFSLFTEFGVDGQLDLLLIDGDIDSLLHSAVPSIEVLSGFCCVVKTGDKLVFGAANVVIGDDKGMFNAEEVTSVINDGENNPA
jgi:hypothetical protein